MIHTAQLLKAHQETSNVSLPSLYLNGTGEKDRPPCELREKSSLCPREDILPVTYQRGLREKLAHLADRSKRRLPAAARCTNVAYKM